MRARDALLGAVLAACGGVPGLAAGPGIGPDAGPYGGGVIGLAVDATDTGQRLFRVTERVPVRGAGTLTLLYPRWEVGSHAPTGPVWDLAGLEVRAEGGAAGGARLGWVRDPLDPYAFRVAVPAGTTGLELRFQYLSTAGAGEVTPELLNLTWSRMLLYPAGMPVGEIPVRASVRLPAGFAAATALDAEAGGASGDGIRRYAPASLARVADSPLYAGAHHLRLDLAPGTARPVAADLFADTEDGLRLDPGRLAKLREAVRQEAMVFGPGQYPRYDMLVSLDDGLRAGGGIEHRRSSEVNLPAGFLRDPGGDRSDETLWTHEYAHSWNGLWRRGTGMVVPDLNRAQDNSCLWVYEGQTELWGVVLAARAGLLTRGEALDLLAVYAATQQARVGRAWKPLADTTEDPSYMIGHRIEWRDWQRREDYYGGGVLLWLDVAMRLDALSGGSAGLDGFARRFFGGDGGDGETVRPYGDAEVARTLDGMARFDWAGLIRGHLEARNDSHLMDGIEAGGYRLVFTAAPTTMFAQDGGGSLDLSYGGGLSVDADGKVGSVAWDGPAFRAGLAPGARIEAVDGTPFGIAVLRDAVARAGHGANGGSGSAPVVLLVRQDGRDREAVLDWRGGLRFPRLERIPGTPDRLGAFLAPRGDGAG